MSKTLLVWVLMYFGGLALAVVHPIYPLVSYLTFYYAPPHHNWWGDMLPDLRFSLLASAVILGSAMLKGAGLEPLKETRNPALKWFLLFGFWVVLVTVWAEDRVRSWVWTVALLKLILLYILIPVTVRTPAHFDIFAGAHIGGATYWGYKAWDDPKREAGRLKDVGGPDTQNENAAAAHLLTALPFVAVYLLSARNRKMQAIIMVCGAFIVNVIILCNSRGATLGLLAMAGAGIAFAGRGRRLKLLGVAAAAAVALLALADPEFVARQQTTVDAQDGSSQGRLIAWQAGLEFIKDHPLGTGGRGFHILSPQYIPEIVESHDGEERSVHNTYLQLGAEWGVPGLVLWGGFIISTMLLLGRARRAAQDNPWYFYRLLAIKLALIGLLVAGIFTNRLYGESLYWMCALAYALHRMHVTVKETAAATDSVSAPPIIAGTLVAGASSR
ncbi:MAG TPA: O-antigen ligase family protein [Vicinamibacterales bacterium]|nr:O-antigen ligase family protein [Vicinamibacterales bacterium]